MASTIPSGGDSAPAPETVDLNPSGGGNSRDDGLPKNFDVLVVGTGLVESIVSAAVSRNGHTVLHIDPRDYYGGTWGTFSLDQWTSTSFMEIPDEAKIDVKITTKEQGSGTVRWRNNVENFEQVWYEDSEDVKDELMKLKRRFNIDLMPKLIAAREDIIQLLITSNVSRYLEFLRVTRLLTNFPSPNENKIESIPLSRADIFTSKSLTLVEKRNLVKLIEAVLKPNFSSVGDNEAELEASSLGSPDVPLTFEDLASVSKASDKLRHMVKSSVTILDDGFSPNDEIFNREFCNRCRLFLNSIGRYGNQTPFLWTLYGISEICQAFCRLSAVYGGIYILKQHISSIDSVDDGFSIRMNNDEIKVKHVVVGPELECDITGKERSKKEEASIVVGRAVLITKGRNIKLPDDSVKSKGDGIFLYRISGTEVIEMNYNSQAVPKDYRLLQISFPIVDSNTGNCRDRVEKVLSPFVDFEFVSPPPETLFEEEPIVSNPDLNIPPTEQPASDTDRKPRVIYGSYFTLTFKSYGVSSELFSRKGDNDSNFCFMESGIASTDLTAYVSKAKEIFASLYEDEEFLPKAPDCEDEEATNDEEIIEGTEHAASNDDLQNLNASVDQPPQANATPPNEVNQNPNE